MYEQEIVGLKALEMLPAICTEIPIPQISCTTSRRSNLFRNGDIYEVQLKLMFANPVDIDVWVTGDELYVQIGNQRKIITLPISLTGLEPGDAVFKDKWLHIPFDLNHQGKHQNQKEFNKV